MKEQTIKCRSCNRSLMHFINYRETEKESFVTATCPFCEDKSDTILIYGDFQVGPIISAESNNPTTIEDIDYDYDSNMALFKIKKVK